MRVRVISVMLVICIQYDNIVLRFVLRSSLCYHHLPTRVYGPIRTLAIVYGNK